MILFLNLLLGLYFCYRTYLLRASYCFTENIIKTCIFIYLIVILTSSQFHIAYALIGIYLPLFLFILVDYLFIYKVRKLFKIHLIKLLNSIIGRIKLGNSFREASRLALNSVEKQRLKDGFSDLWTQIILHQELEDHYIPEYLFAHRVLSKADQSLQPLNYLSYVRYTLKIEMSFRKKILQALTQIYLQSYIMIVLYLFLLGFTLYYYKREHLTLIFFSIFLFSTGTFLVFLGGRRIKWTL